VKWFRVKHACRECKVRWTNNTCHGQAVLGAAAELTSLLWGTCKELCCSLLLSNMLVRLLGSSDTKHASTQSNQRLQFNQQ
jgi:hypothetical protein